MLGTLFSIDRISARKIFLISIFDILFLNENKSLLFQGNQVAEFVVNIQVLSNQVKLEFLKSYCYFYHLRVGGFIHCVGASIVL